MPEPAVVSPKPRRRHALSLRVLMAMVLIIGAGLGWMARRASIQRRGVSAIRNVGGTIRYDFQGGSGKFLPGATPWAPAWLRGPIGDEYFQEPSSVFLGDSTPPSGLRPTDATLDAVATLDHVDFLQTYRVSISDAGFAKLATMPRLAQVCLLDIDLTDEGLAPLPSFPALNTLRLRVSPPGGFTPRAMELIARQPRIKFLELLNINLPDPASLAPLAKLTRLEYLRLWRSPPDDACLEHLRDLTALEILDLRETKLTDSGVDRIAKLGKLKTVLFDGSKLTDAGLAKLATRASLDQLWISPAPKITDAGLASLASLAVMADLDLPGSNVTDAGLEHLKGLKLDSLNVSGLGVTDAGLARLTTSCQYRDLHLTGTSITSAGLASLSGQTKLRTLSLERTKVDDAGLTSLGALPLMEHLSLSGLPVTDAGVLGLVKTAPRLRLLDVRGTRLTAHGLAALNALKPGLTVVSSPWLKIRQTLDRFLPFGPRK